MCTNHTRHFVYIKTVTNYYTIMTNKIKFHQLKIISLNGTKYYGYLLHQLPKKYEEISPLDQFNLNGFTYICEYAVELTKNQLETRTSNISIGGINTI